MRTKALSDAAYVRRHFEALCAHIGLKDRTAIEAEWAAIETAYAEPHRAYHNMAHIAFMLRKMDEFNIPESEMHRLRAFAIYHDIFYETADLAQYPYNEKRSALRAAAFLLEAGADEGFTRSVSDLVIGTKTHQWDAETDPYGALALDIDMMVVAGSDQEYSTYVDGIRREFASLSDEEFLKARHERFLKPRIAQENLFLTKRMRNHYNAQARGNMMREEAGIWLRLRYMPK